MIKLTINPDAYSSVSVLCETKQQASKLAELLTGLHLINSTWDANSERYDYVEKNRCTVSMAFPESILSYEQHLSEEEARNAKD